MTWKINTLLLEYLKKNEENRKICKKFEKSYEILKKIGERLKKILWKFTNTFDGGAFGRTCPKGAGGPKNQLQNVWPWGWCDVRATPGPAQLLNVHRFASQRGCLFIGPCWHTPIARELRKMTTSWSIPWWLLRERNHQRVVSERDRKKFLTNQWSKIGFICGARGLMGLNLRAL